MKKKESNCSRPYSLLLLLEVVETTLVLGLCLKSTQSRILILSPGSEVTVFRRDSCNLGKSIREQPKLHS